VEQVSELGGIAMFACDQLRNSHFPRSTLRQIKHQPGGIEQRHVMAKFRQAHRTGPGSGPNIQSV
jgi:hypothetical protein